MEIEVDPTLPINNNFIRVLADTGGTTQNFTLPLPGNLYRKIFELPWIATRSPGLWKSCGLGFSPRECCKPSQQFNLHRMSTLLASLGLVAMISNIGG